jgi:hypothetical protein
MTNIGKICNFVYSYSIYNILQDEIYQLFDYDCCCYDYFSISHGAAEPMAEG